MRRVPCPLVLAALSLTGPLAAAPLAPQGDHAPDVPGDEGGWTSGPQMRSDYDAAAAANPSIAQVVVLGSSVQGRDLWAMKISDNVTLEENEPEVVFWAAIHGDEFGSAQTNYQYGLDLLGRYGVDPLVTQAIDDLEIWIVPLVNPDGYANGTRNNANGVDLNRDLGFNWDKAGGSSSPFSQVETQVLRDFCLAGNITLSVTHHCSGNIFLYPWGFHPNPTPDATVFQEVGALYATAASYALLNSWSDYETHGELLDFVYGSLGGVCYTSEMSNNPGLIGDTFARNKAGMDAFLAVADQGLHGLVTDAATGQPVHAAVWVEGNPVPAYTDPTVGDVHRLLQPGIYDVTVWANGYLPATVEDVLIPAGGSASFSVALQPGGNHHGFQVTSVNQHDNFNAHQNTTLPNEALGAPDGAVASLGVEGFLVLDTGAGNEVVDGPGVDLTITEALFPGDNLPEAYRVFVGDAYDQSTLVGTGVGTQSFDLAGTGVASSRYVRVEDATAGDPDDPFAGFDLDALTILNGAGQVTALAGDVASVSLATGGTQTLQLAAPYVAELYLILGSASGTTPGTTAVPSLLTLPLNNDAYLNYTLTNPNTVLMPSLGTLDASGLASAVLTVPPGLNPGLAGTTLDHAFVVLDPVTLGTVFVSNPVALTLTP